MTIISFRQVLKRRTNTHHARVDSTLSSLKIYNRDEYIRFLDIHHTCFRAMLDAAVTDMEMGQRLEEMVMCIRADLNSLTDADPQTTIPRLPYIDPLAMDYMVEGSRMGTQVLKRQWAISLDPGVRSANAYFSIPPTASRWRNLCEMLSSIPVLSNRAERITEDTKILFDLFYHAAIDPDTSVDPDLELIG